MAWFGVKLIVECQVEGNCPPLCDEQLRLVHATDLAAAIEEANRLGAEEEHEYMNVDGAAVRWRYAGIADIEELLFDTIESGVEVQSTLHHGVAGADLVTAPVHLTAVRVEQNLDKRSGDLLSPAMRPYAPK